MIDTENNIYLFNGRKECRTLRYLFLWITYVHKRTHIYIYIYIYIYIHIYTHILDRGIIVVESKNGLWNMHGRITIML
jgi:hypothetical protein